MGYTYISSTTWVIFDCYVELLEGRDVVKTLIHGMRGSPVLLPRHNRDGTWCVWNIEKGGES